MTISRIVYPHRYTGLSTDIKPVIQGNGDAVPAGSQFYETDTHETWEFDGVSTWNRMYEAARYYLDNRVSITITTTSSHIFSAGSITKYGDQIYQYTIECTAAGGAPTRTLSIENSDGVAIWTSTAITDNSNVVGLLAVNQRAIVDGVYNLVWTLSTCSTTTGITDYVTLGFGRG